MNWQDLIALIIVACTATLFLWNRFRPRQLGSSCHGGCGCKPSPSERPQGSIVYRARKGQRPEILLRQK